MPLMINLMILGFSAIVRLWNFGYPLQVVFDEVHIGKFVTGYFTGQYFFDIHPPLARLLVALSGYASGMRNEIVDWSHIGNSIPDAAVFMRAFPAMAGIFLPLLVYLILRRLEISKIAAGVASMLIIFENSLITGSRFMVHDSIYIFFGFSALYFYLRSRSGKGRIAYLALSAISLGSSVSVKWIGLSFLAVIFVVESLDALSSRPKKITEVLTKIGRTSIVYITSIAVVYISLFVVHLSILEKSGSGDAFMSKRFQASLVGNPNRTDGEIVPLGFFGKFVELNKRMFLAQKNLNAEHAYSSEWYEWPVMKRPILYWSGNGDHIYLFGNPVVYWVGTLAILGLLSWTFIKFVRRHRMEQREATALAVIAFGYLTTLLPFMLISRPMFLYHYHVALIYSVMAIAFFIDRLPQKKELVSISLLAAAILSFFIYAPITYGTHLSPEEREIRTFLPSWR